MISKCTEDELRKVCVIIDQVIASWINDDDVEAEEEDKKTNLLPRCGLRRIPGELSWDELSSHAKRIMYRCQLHNRCSFTCFKGRSHEQTCRMALPTDYCDQLRFFQLRERLDGYGKMLIPKKDRTIDPPPIDAPIPPKDKRVTICRMKKISEIDTQLVNGNIEISTVAGCNSCIEFVSSPGSAQGSFFYIANYMRKAMDKPAAILPLVHSANKKRNKYPSKAKDAGTSSRNAKYLTQIILNRLNGGEEVPDQVAASFMYGFDSHISSHSFQNFYPVDLYNYVKTVGKSHLSEETSELDANDCQEPYEKDSEEEKLEVPGMNLSSGQGQPVRPSRCKLSVRRQGNY